MIIDSIKDSTIAEPSKLAFDPIPKSEIKKDIKSEFNQSRMTAFEKVLEDLSQNSPALTKAIFEDDCGLTDTEAQQLAIALERNQICQQLELNISTMTDVGIKSLATMLKKNKSIAELTLFGNMTNENVKLLAEALTLNKGITGLSLAAHISNIGVAALTKMLKKNHRLQRLRLILQQFCKHYEQRPC